MKIIKPLVIIVLVIVSSYMVMAILGPADYKVSKAIKIAAPIDVVFDHTSIFSNWAAWSPWAKKDPSAKYTIEKDNQTVGASMRWEGDPKTVGKGGMLITAIEKIKFVTYDLTFYEPWQMVSHGGFNYTQIGDSVLLEWFDEGEFEFLSRPMMLFMDMDEMIGADFMEGLNNIKEICENMKQKQNVAITEEMVESKSILYISETSSLMPDSIGAKMGAAYGEIMALMSVAQLDMVSPPIAITRKYDMMNMSCEFDPAIPIANLPEDLNLSGRIQKGETYSGKVLKIVHTGSYVTLKATYDMMLAYIEKNDFEKNGFSWEEYIDDPAEVSEDKRRTNIYFPVK